MSQYQPPFLVFVDESGDHNMKGWDPNYPILVLASVMISPQELERAKEQFDNLKLAYFGTTEVILHEADIRKRRKEFASLGRKGILSFMEDISKIISGLDFKVVAAIIDKRKLAEGYGSPIDPYYLATQFILERVHMHRGLRMSHIPIPVHFERRGKREDRKLESYVQKILSGGGPMSMWPIPNLEIKFLSKQDNEIGLQIADLIARPIGVDYLNQQNFFDPPKRNPPYEIIWTKFRKQNGQVMGFGLKLFP